MKKKLSHLIPIALILFLLPAAALAFDGKNYHQRDPDRIADRLEKYLELNATQKEALKPVLTEMMEKRQAMIADLHEKTKAAMKALDTEEEAKLKGIFNEEQMEAFRRLREEKREKAMNRHHKKGKGHPGFKAVETEE